MRLRQLWVQNFRGYASIDIEFPEGLTAVIGRNGHGKTNLAESIGWLASLKSFRGAPTAALLRTDAEAAIVRGDIDSAGREVLIETEIPRQGRVRAQVNRQRLTRSRDLLGLFRVSVFSPEDLNLVKGSPGERRTYIDDVLVDLHLRNDKLQGDVDRILKQRNALLRGAGGRLTQDVQLTLDVWDAKLTTSGEALAKARCEALDLLVPALTRAYDDVAREPAEVHATYRSEWQDVGLAEALLAARKDDLRRGVTTTGPHRDDIELLLNGLSSRTHASQGEQRSVALALRLAAHEAVTEVTGSPPVLLLDDVFSELDPYRSAALVEYLPKGQAVLTSASGLPPGAEPELTIEVVEHTLRPKPR